MGIKRLTREDIAVPVLRNDAFIAERDSETGFIIEAD